MFRLASHFSILLIQYCYFQNCKYGAGKWSDTQFFYLGFHSADSNIDNFIPWFGIHVDSITSISNTQRR